MMTLGLQRSVLLLLCGAAALLAGCVSQGKYTDLENRYTTLQGQYTTLQQTSAAQAAQSAAEIAALKQETLAFGDLGQARHKVACFTGEDEWRIGFQPRLDFGQSRGVRIHRHLLDRLVPPSAGVPIFNRLGHFDFLQNVVGYRG